MLLSYPNLQELNIACALVLTNCQSAYALSDWSIQIENLQIA